MQISQVMTSYTQPNFYQRWWKKDISANLYQKCLILCCKILRNLLHNLSLTVLLPWQHTGFQTSPILKAFLATFGVSIHICKWCLIYTIQQAYKYVRLSLWPCLTFFELKITYILNQLGGNWKTVSSHVFVFCRSIDLPSFNALRCKLTKIVLFNILDVILGWAYDIISHLTCIFHTYLKLKYLRS